MILYLLWMVTRQYLIFEMEFVFDEEAVGYVVDGIPQELVLLVACTVLVLLVYRIPRKRCLVLAAVQAFRNYVAARELKVCQTYPRDPSRYEGQGGRLF